MSRQGPVLRIETPVRFRGLLRLRQAVRLEVTVPPALARYHVRTTGDVELVGLAATGRVEPKAGDFTARSRAGELVIQSGAGDVEVRDGVIERLTLQSGAGDVECAAHFTGRASIATGAGDVTLRPESEGDAEIEVKSGFGDVTLHLDWVRGGSLEMRTGAGSVEGTAGIRFTRRGGIGVYSADVLGPGSGFIRLTTLLAAVPPGVLGRTMGGACALNTAAVPPGVAVAGALMIALPLALLWILLGALTLATGLTLAAPVEDDLARAVSGGAGPREL
ncbi:MAG: DUF4097 domain-containing protein [Chloroflexi bacterium]|nr:DUF4097 domain-containing protein [Chloroflexota bacterium]